MPAGSGDWYVRGQGRILGPFNWSQLLSLRDRGQVSQASEVSQDRRSWIKAGDVPGLYSQSVTRAEATAAPAQGEWPVIAIQGDPGYGAAAPVAAEAAPSWYVVRGETHHGPVYLADVQRMIDSGELGPSSMVWKEGLAGWVAASQVPELRFLPHGAAMPAAHSPYAGHAAGIGNPYAYPQVRTSALAVASFVLGLVWLCGLGSLLATIFGAVSLSQIARSNGTIAGRGLALAGLILGIIGLLVVPLLYFSGFLAAFLDQAQPRPRPGS